MCVSTVTSFPLAIGGLAGDAALMQLWECTVELMERPHETLVHLALHVSQSSLAHCHNVVIKAGEGGNKKLSNLY